MVKSRMGVGVEVGGGLGSLLPAPALILKIELALLLFKWLSGK